MASRVKNNPFCKSHPNDEFVRKPTWRTLSSDQDLASLSHNAHRQEHVHVQNGSSRQITDHRTYSNDPSQVRKWVVTSATGSQSPTENNFLQASGITSSRDIPHSGFTLPDHFSTMQSSVSELSLSSSHVRMFDFHDPRISSDIACTTSAGDAMTMAMYGTFPSDSHFINTGYQVDENSDYNTWSSAEARSYIVPSSVDMVYSTSAEMHHDFVDYTGDSWLHSQWPEAQYQRQEQGPTLPFSSGQTTVSSLTAVAMEPSISSFSQSSFLPPQTGSPQSTTTQEEPPSVDLNAFPDEEYGIPPLTIDGTTNFFNSYDFCDGQSGIPSMSKSPQIFQQTSLSNMALWSSSDIPNSEIMANPFGDTYLQRRMSGDGEVSNARQHELYQVGPQEDGLYHCPFEVKDGCTHKAEKLKCNYDKHLDSHLKPYRCKVPSCFSVPFSSTACLLRHEREAHGMHGHGEKPYLCTYEECDRSNVGNGFPRRWNLQDHMKRVHDYTAPPSSTGSTSPTPSTASSQYPGKAAIPLRKRRTSNNSQASAPKRTKPTPATIKTAPKASRNNIASPPERKQRQIKQKQWHEQHAALKEHLDGLNPTDALGHEQLGAKYKDLLCLGEDLRRMEAGQLTMKNE